MLTRARPMEKCPIEKMLKEELEDRLMAKYKYFSKLPKQQTKINKRTRKHCKAKTNDKVE